MESKYHGSPDKLLIWKTAVNAEPTYDKPDHRVDQFK